MARIIGWLWLWYGLIGVAIWLALVNWALIDYPSLDHLLVGWPVFVFEGVDPLGALRYQPMKFTMLVLAETTIVFLFFAAVGLARQYFVQRRQTS